jgi:hypothetical protein
MAGESNECPFRTERNRLVSGQPFDGEAVGEVSLCLTHRQALALEERAHQRGLTAAELLRRLIEEFIRPDVPPRDEP